MLKQWIPKIFFVAALVTALLFLPDYGNKPAVWVQNPFEENLYVDAHRGLEGQR